MRWYFESKSNEFFKRGLYNFANRSKEVLGSNGDYAND